MQPGLFVALGIFIVIGLLVQRYTRGPLIQLRGRRRLRHDTLTFADGQAWAIGYHGTIADARRFYADAAPSHGWRLTGDTGSIIFTRVRAVGVSAGWSDTTLLHLRRPEGR
ncbi:MAG TPA: hypothetical protein VFM14_01730 [Gemmatimonadales bacterium]|nr:hypothetical protein [Gemmatimonadales bacterium]